MSDPVTILPANSSLFERGLDLAFARLLERIEPPFPELMSPQTTPVDFLPYLAADRGVDEWRSAAPVSELRATVDAAWKTKRLAGTQAALEQAVAGLEMTPEVVAWHEQVPRGQPYSFRVMAWLERAYDEDVDQRLTKRIQAAKSERDQVVVTLGVQTRGALCIGGVAFAGDIVTVQPYQLTEVTAPVMVLRPAVGRYDSSTTTIYPGAQ